MKKRYIPSILIVLCLLINACVGAAYAKYVSVKKAENLFSLSSEVIPDVEPEPYAAYSANTNTLYFLNDILINAGKTIPGTNNDIATEVYTDILGNAEEDQDAKWSNYAGGIHTVKFLGDIKPVSIYSWFNGCTSLTTIHGMTEHLETNRVTNMSSAFAGCTSLTTLDLSGFNTKSVMNYSYMFQNCSNLKTIYASESFEINGRALAILGFEGTVGFFEGCTSLVGGNNTDFDETKTNHTYAWIDGRDGRPGYFTLKGASTFAVEPTCTCENKCEEQNEDCEVCNTDITNCEGAETPAGEELTCTCEIKCTALNEACEVCKSDITHCKGAEAPTENDPPADEQGDQPDAGEEQTTPPNDPPADGPPSDDGQGDQPDAGAEQITPPNDPPADGPSSDDEQGEQPTEGTEATTPSAVPGGDVITNTEERTSPAEQESTESQGPTEPVNASADPAILPSESTGEDEAQQEPQE